MSRILAVSLLSFLCWCLPYVCYCEEFGKGNVMVVKRVINYEIKSTDSMPERISKTEEQTFRASRSAATGFMVTAYDDDIEISKASAPGAQTVYRALEDDDIFYSGSRMCLLPVELKPGKEVKATVKSINKNPPLLSPLILPLSRYDVLHTEVTVNIPSDLAGKVTVTEKNMPPGAKGVITSTGKGSVYTLKVDSIASYPKEPMAPSMVNYVPMIIINVSFPEVKDLYKYLNSRVLAEEPSEKITDLSRQLTSGAQTEMDKINAIARWVRQNIRYVAIEHGAYGHSPDAAVSVLEKRYGDCKGSANLIRALLTAAGIDGRLVWIGTRGSVAGSLSADHIIASCNHMIAAAMPADNDTIVFLDGTLKFAPDGYIPLSIAGQECLIQNGDEYILTRVPRVKGPAGVMNLDCRMTIDGNRLCAAGEVTFLGDWQLMVDGIFDNVSASKRSQLYAAILKGDKRGASLGSAEKTPGDSCRIIFSDLTDSGALRITDGGNRLYVMSRPLRFLPYETVKDRDRRLPFDVNSSFAVRGNYDIALPDGFVAEKLPEPKVFDNKWFKGHVTYTLTDDGRRVLIDSYVEPVELTGKPDELPKWNAALKDVIKTSNSPLILSRKTE